MKIDIQNKPCWIYAGFVLIGCIISGLLITTEGLVAKGLAMSTTQLLLIFGITLGFFSTPHKNVRKRNILRIILMMTSFHLVSVISHNGLSGIDTICKTNHPTKVVETFQKTYSSIKVPLVKMGKIFGEDAQKEKEIAKKEKGVKSFENFFSYNYLILTIGISICLYKIFFSWSTEAFFLAVLTLILTTVYLHFCWSNPWQWKAIWSLIVIVPLGITVYFGKDYQMNPATS